MNILSQCGILFAICLGGELLRAVTKLPVPGNVFGMALLFALLCAGVVKKSHIAQVSDFLLTNMSFFFIPSGVAILAYYPTIAKVIVPYLLILLLTTVLVLGATGQAAQIMQRLLRGKLTDEDQGGRAK